MADRSDRSPSLRTWIVSILALVFPYSFLITMIALFEYCATRGSP